MCDYQNDTLNYIFNLEFFDLIRKEKCHKIRIGDLGIPRKKRAGVIFCYLIVIFLFLADYWSYAHFLPGKTLMTVIVAFDNGLVRSQCDQRDYHAFTCIIRKKQTLTYHYQTTFSMKLNTLSVGHRVFQN